MQVNERGKKYYYYYFYSVRVLHLQYSHSGQGEDGQEGCDFGSTHFGQVGHFLAEGCTGHLFTEGQGVGTGQILIGGQDDVF